MQVPEPLIRPVAIAELRPTQMTVGFREVAEKRRRWKARSTRAGAEFLGRHMIPVVKGPRGRSYVIDHHHLVLALLHEGVEDILTSTIADLSMLDAREFWVFADHRGWCHPYDAQGVRRKFDAIPRRVAHLQDDPYRSLAGEVRQAGGYAKDTLPFSEFLWADFLRGRIKRPLVDSDFAAALAKALKLARSPKARYLPGWCGPMEDD